MKYRDRFENAVHHRKVDRAPFDLAGTSLTGVTHGHTQEALRQHLGIEGEPDHGYSKFDERILKRLDIDFRRVGDILDPSSPLTQKISDVEYIDCWGITRVFTGTYWDIKRHPLKGADVGDLKKFRWPRACDIDLGQVESFREQARRLYEDTDYVVCAEHPVFGVLELGCWMCGFDDFLLKMALDPEFVYSFFDKVLDYQKEIIKIYYGALGEYIHFTTSGDDFGTQKGPFVSPAMFREMIAPYYKERIRYTKEFTDAYYFHHTCGSVYRLIPDLIDSGVDILNPIQPGAKNMEPERLKSEFGDAITFWGGIDTQHVLPEGTPEDVCREVRRVLAAMGDSGYVLSPAHNIQPDVPPQNIVAMFDAAKEYYHK